MKKDVVTPTRKFRIAERLAQARRSVSPALSQVALGKQVQAIGLKDCSGSRLSRLEAGYADAQWHEIEVLASVLKVTAQWLAAVDDPAPLLSAPPAPVVVAPPGPSDPPAPAQADGIHPDLTLLDRGAHRSDYEFRQHLAAALGRARSKLNEAGLPAADWKHWRTVERRVMEELRRCSWEADEAFDATLSLPFNDANHQPMKLPALFAHVWILFVAVTVLDAVMGVSETGTTVTRSWPCFAYETFQAWTGASGLDLFCIRNTMRLDEAGALIREARRQAGLTQAELAARRHMSRSTVSQIENGVIAEIGLRKFVGLCAELGLTFEVVPIVRPTLSEALVKARADVFHAAVRTDDAINSRANGRL